MIALLKRRQLLSAASKLPLLAVAAWSGARLRVARAFAPAGPELDARQSAMLERLAYLLFPYPELGPEPYRRVSAAMQAAVSGEPQLLLVSEGLADLDRRSDGDWLQLPEARQLEALQAVQSSDFFRWALQVTQSSLFHDPEVWALIGYEGSSLEHGGYLNRGLSDIDWLPEAADHE